jgi:uncharacterized membrane protein YfcA
LIQLPDTAAFAAILSDGRFAAAVVIAVLAGVVRGFSGFGSALIYVPLIAAAYEPRIATVSFVLMDFTCVAPFAPRSFAQCRWRELLPAYGAAVLTVPLGTLMQSAVDPVTLRWGMAGFVLVFLPLLVAGWRYPWKAGAPAAISAGALSGFAGGAAQLGGPPVILYWLGNSGSAAFVRDNLMVYLVLLSMTLLANYAWQGLMTAQPIALAVMLWPVYIVALLAGASWFRGVSDQHYRWAAYIIVALTAIVSMPIFDGLLH